MPSVVVNCKYFLFMSDVHAGHLINTSGEGPEGTHKTNVKGPGLNVNHRDAIGATMMGHARGKECAALLGSAIQGCRVHFMFKH